jgi:hypothetical protein
VSQKYTAESLKSSHDGMCPEAIGDGECACLVCVVLRLQAEVERLTEERNSFRQMERTRGAEVERLQKIVDDWKGVIAAHQPSSASFGPGNEPPPVTTYAYP